MTQDNSTPREGYDQKKYDEAWERIFGKKKEKDADKKV
jgi:hypothetical protein